MRTITLGITFKGPFEQHGKSGAISSGMYGLTLHNDRTQDDLGVHPLLCVGAVQPNQSKRLLTIWPTGIQLGKLVLRIGYLCVGGDAVDGKPSTSYHPGPKQAAIEHFHGLFGPKWQVALDGVPGYFTVPGDNDEVKFIVGYVPQGLEDEDENEGPTSSPDVRVGAAVTEPALTEGEHERRNGNRVRAMLKVRVTSHFRAAGQTSGLGDWLAQMYSGKRSVDSLTVREAEAALEALVKLQRDGKPGKYDRATLDALDDVGVMALYGQEFTGDATTGRAHATQRLLSILG